MKFAAAFLVVGTAMVSAHEIGTSRVAIVFDQNRTYDIELVTDATALGEKLESVAGRELSSKADAAFLQSLFIGTDQRFRQRVKVVFDGAEVRPEITYAVVPPIDATSAAAATIHLKGDIPPGAKQFTWTFGWTFASYAFMIRNGVSAQPATQWLEGGQTSAHLCWPLPRRWSLDGIRRGGT